jgi:translation elongation factor EF-Tu-like GTPase
MTMRLVLVFTITLLSLFRAAMANGLDVVFLGDNARIEVAKQCEAKCQFGTLKVGTPPLNSTASIVANYAQNAKHAVVVVDATQGPLPITREHILIARQAGVPSLSMMFVYMARLNGRPDATELIRLEEREVRELMNVYGMGGYNNAMVFHDVAIKATPTLNSNGVGLRTAFEKIYAVPTRKTYNVRYYSGKILSTYVYLLTPQEAKSVVPLKQNSAIDIWVNGQSVRGHVRSKQGLMPGSDGELVIELAKSVSAAEGSRFLIEKDGKIVAAGVVVRVGS